MKLLRYGPSGQEKPGMLDSKGKIRDLSKIVQDFDGDALSPRSISKISKGEIKEYHEWFLRNSQIYIKIDRGGLGLIEVKDNGIGMNPQEMLLSIDGKNNYKNITNKLFGTNGNMLHQISKIGKIELICQ